MIVGAIVGLIGGEIVAMVISAPVIEETSKAIGIVWAVRRREVDGPSARRRCGRLGCLFGGCRLFGRRRRRLVLHLGENLLDGLVRQSRVNIDEIACLRPRSAATGRPSAGW